MYVQVLSAHLYNFCASILFSRTHHQAHSTQITDLVSRFQLLSSGNAWIQYIPHENSIQYGINFQADFEIIDSLFVLNLNLPCGVGCFSSPVDISKVHIFFHFS
jgi:hypothetical protein